MTTIDPPVPPPFTGEDFAARMRRVVELGGRERTGRSHCDARPGFGLAHRLPANGDH